MLDYTLFPVPASKLGIRVKGQTSLTDTGPNSGPERIKVFSHWSVPKKEARKWIWIALAFVAALQLYYVREMIAAFVVLGVVFALIAGSGMLLFLVDRANGRTLTSAEMSGPAIPRTTRRGVHFASALTAKRPAARVDQVSVLNRTRLRHPRLGTAR